MTHNSAFLNSKSKLKRQTCLLKIKYLMSNDTRDNVGKKQMHYVTERNGL